MIEINPVMVLDCPVGNLWWVRDDAVVYRVSYNGDTLRIIDACHHSRNAASVAASAHFRANRWEIERQTGAMYD